MVCLEPRRTLRQQHYLYARIRDPNQQMYGEEHQLVVKHT